MKIFADGADLDGILALAADPHIRASRRTRRLMWKAGPHRLRGLRAAAARADHEAPDLLRGLRRRADEMRRQARMIRSWGENVYVKIPVTTTGRVDGAARARALRGRREGERHRAVHHGAGRADHRGRQATARRRTSRSSRGGSPTPGSTRCRSWRGRSRSWSTRRASELIWASPREMLNVVQADRSAATSSR